MEHISLNYVPCTSYYEIRNFLYTKHEFGDSLSGQEGPRDCNDFLVQPFDLLSAIYH